MRRNIVLQATAAQQASWLPVLTDKHHGSGFFVGRSGGSDDSCQNSRLFTLRQGEEFRPKMRYTDKHQAVKGSFRMRWPVARNNALASAGANGGTDGSPNPVGGASVRANTASISTGASLIRSMW